nr:response regulator receiver domain [Brevundimonas diminuta]
MADVAPALLREAFIDPIRFALLIDDEFRSFDRLLDGDKIKDDDKARMKGLFTFCRERGWLCDVEGDFNRISTMEGPAGLHQSDLLILDFHLDPSKDTDSSASVSLIQKLDASPHLNLVVVYTSDDIHTVALDVAFGLGGGKLASMERAEASREQLDDLGDAVGEFAPSTDLLNAFLLDDRASPSMRAYRTRLTEAGASVPEANAIITTICGDYFRRRMSEQTVAARPLAASVTANISSDVPWVSGDNVFVAVVSKDYGPEQIEDRLCAALASWKPSPLQVMLVHARSAMEKAGSKYDQKVLESPLTQAGWILDVLSTSPDSRGKRLSDLYGNLFHRLSSELQHAVGQFGQKLFRADEGKSALDLARDWSGVQAATGDNDIYHAANEFLCSDKPPKDGRLTTGLIFSVSFGNGGGDKQLLVCTTPSCDLVPDQNVRGWDAQLLPMKAVYATRLRPTPNEEVTRSLQQATQGRHLYLTVDNRPRVYEFVDEHTRQANLEVIFVGDNGRYLNTKFAGQVVRMVDGAPVLQAAEFKVIAQLRPHYANKLLMDAGQQKARIGLAWLPMPVPTPEDAEPVEDGVSEPAAEVEPAV